MARKNVFDTEAEELAASMTEASEELAGMAEGVEPFDSAPLSEPEMLFYYQNPAAFYPEFEGQITNAEAATMMLEEMGPVAYVQMVEKMHRLLNGGK